MRLAFSAAAAMSGLVLLGLAEYGEPAMLLNGVRHYWDTLMYSPPPEPAAPPEAVAQRVDQLQQEVAALKRVLAARTAGPAPSVPVSAPAAATSAVAPAGTLPGTPPETSPQTSPGTSPGMAAPATAAAAVTPPMLAQATARPPQVQTAAPVAEARTAALAAHKPPQPGTPRVAAAGPPQAPAPAAATILVVPPPASAAPHAFRPREATAQPSARTLPANPPRPRQPRPAETVRPAQPDDAMRSVLARLRQADPLPPPVQQAAPPPPSPSLPRLMQARADLMGGHVEEAVRHLQEAQLQLVFRPIDAAGGNPAASGAAAADVARALEALSGNNIPASQQYIAGAMRDLRGGTPIDAAPTTANQAWNGYAPAYPSR